MRNFGVVGFPIGHTFSPEYFRKKFIQLEVQDATYKAFEMSDITCIKELVSSNNLTGFNVTIPHKQEIVKYLDFLDPVAAEMNAVNVVKVANGKLFGLNTDYYGFKESLLSIIPMGASALIFGSGGSSAAIKYVLKKLGIKYTVVSRDATKGVLYSSLSENDISSNLLLINTTPLGMADTNKQCVDIPYSGITSRHLCYDLIYNPLETEFLRRCKERGAIIKNGLQMLELQADKSWDIWNS